MKTKKQIQKELEKYKVLDHPEEIAKRGLYQGPRPMSEWVYHQDIGFKKALEWVLEIKKNEKS